MIILLAIRYISLHKIVLLKKKKKIAKYLYSKYNFHKLGSNLFNKNNNLNVVMQCFMIYL